MTEIVVRSALKDDIKPGVVLWKAEHPLPLAPYLVFDAFGADPEGFAVCPIGKSEILNLYLEHGDCDDDFWYVSADGDTSNIVLDALTRVAELSAVTPSQGPPTVDGEDVQPGDMYTDPHGQVFILVEDIGYSKWNTAYMYADTWRITTLDYLQRKAMRRLPHTHRLDVTVPDWLNLPEARPLPDYLPRLEPVDEIHNVRFTDVNGVAHDLQFRHSMYDEVLIANDRFLGPVAINHKDCLLGRDLVAVFTKTDAGFWVHDPTHCVDRPPTLEHVGGWGARYTDETGDTYPLPRFDPGHNTEVHVAISAVTGGAYVCDPENPNRVAAFERATTSSTEWTHKP